MKVYAMKKLLLFCLILSQGCALFAAENERNAERTREQDARGSQAVHAVGSLMFLGCAAFGGACALSYAAVSRAHESAKKFIDPFWALTSSNSQTRSHAWRCLNAACKAMYGHGGQDDDSDKD